jgi:hypothetical protein
MIFCKNCRHIIRFPAELSAPLLPELSVLENTARCYAIDYEPSPVSGEVKHPLCRVARDIAGECGPDAKLFEAAKPF